MLNQFSRTQLVFGRDAMETLANSRVAVFGIGGVAAIPLRRWHVRESASSI